MSTIIYPSPIFGPVHSRRLGVSLGINLMPADGKVCTFDCAYCECGLDADHRARLPRPTREQVAEALKARLLRMKAEGPAPDVLTFAGNGEPTAHPDFPAIIDDTIALRDRFFPAARVSVLSNATMTGRKAVHDALMRIDNNIQKLDTVAPDYIRLLDRPQGKYDVEEIIRHLRDFRGHVIIQTMFLDGTLDGHNVRNTGDEYVLPWIDALRTIGPKSVMIYTIDRETPIATLAKATPAELDRIRDMVVAQTGLQCSVSY